MLLNILRRTIIPPLWEVFRRIPGGVELWYRCERLLLCIEPRQLDPARLEQGLDPRDSRK
jgi:hypothetical protein